jgi:hypothetical protein
MDDPLALALRVMAEAFAEAEDILKNMLEETERELENKRRLQELVRQLAEAKLSLETFVQGVVHVNPDVDVVSHHPVFPPPHSH